MRLWLPLLGGSDRLGVLAVDLARAPDEATMSTLWGLALASAGLVVSKHAYSDACEMVRRREHATLPTEIQHRAPAAAEREHRRRHHRRDPRARQRAPESMRRLMRHVLGHHRYELRDDAMLLLLDWFGPSREREG